MFNIDKAMMNGMATLRIRIPTISPLRVAEQHHEQLGNYLKELENRLRKRGALVTQEDLKILKANQEVDMSFIDAPHVLESQETHDRLERLYRARKKDLEKHKRELQGIKVWLGSVRRNLGARISANRTDWLHAIAHNELPQGHEIPMLEKAAKTWRRRLLALRIGIAGSDLWRTSNYTPTTAKPILQHLRKADLLKPEQVRRLFEAVRRETEQFGGMSNNSFSSLVRKEMGIHAEEWIWLENNLTPSQKEKERAAVRRRSKEVYGTYSRPQKTVGKLS